ncbi:ATP synthase subunit beta [Afipia sp. Root123D2]|uniref:class I SAM-dependent methyltransferase n=1 Tax=Afipia sp. Root123D2 TaxID=1736436 RepID=UPI0006F9711A|nr:SAM-dependent methyltransferase [Afipia sp. Root123D2]KQW21103.1 ATP synthase subunit beta [Afipia sp. Root123D2]
MTEFSPLEAHIRHLIATSGPMPVSRYMQLCLTHPEHGYYVARDPLGREGDFTTAPEVSQMFGELLGLWAASVWSAMGMPPEVQLIELGPGRGTMMNDALRAIRILPAFHEAIHVHLVEVSPTLRARQRETLGDTRPVQWHHLLEDIPPGPAIILANEYFDVLPVHQMVKKDTGWHERMIDVDDDIFVFTTAPDPAPRFEVLLPPQVRAAPSGAIFEWRAPTEIMTLARRIRDHGGAALIIDYGHLRSDAGDTLQAVAQHSYANPLRSPGQADITAHVDFQALALAAEDVGVRTHGPVEQGVFLNRLGIDTRAQTLIKHSSNVGAGDVASALLRLTDSGNKGMGSLFKVLGISHPSIETLAALSDLPLPPGPAAP